MEMQPLRGIAAQVNIQLVEGAVLNTDNLGQVADQADLHRTPLQCGQVVEAVGDGGEMAACADRVGQAPLPA